MSKNNKEEYHLNYKCKYLLMCKREINSKTDKTHSHAYTTYLLREWRFQFNRIQRAGINRDEIL